MRRLFIVALSLVTLVASAQRKPYQLNAQTPEGQLLQKANQEEDESRKIAIYEEYLAKFPQHDGHIYALTQLQPLLLKAKQLDKTIEGGEAILKVEPENAPAAYNVLQAYEQKKDAAGVITWANRTVDAARKMLAMPKPSDQEELATWKYQQDYATQVITRAEYSLYAQGLQSTDPAKAVQLFSALETMNPKSEYMPQAGARYFVVLLQLKDLQKARQLAETMAANNVANDDILLFLADVTLSEGKDFAKAAEYATKLVDTLPSMAAPQGMDPAAWEAKKKTSMARALWIAGSAYGAQSKWVESDKAMRTALPLLAGNDDLLPGAYFYLGLSNYKMSEGPKGDKSKMADARKYTTLASQMKSPFQEPAQKNLKAMSGK